MPWPLEHWQYSRGLPHALVCRAEEVRETFEKFGELRWGLLQLHDAVQVLLLLTHASVLCRDIYLPKGSHCHCFAQTRLPFLLPVPHPVYCLLTSAACTCRLLHRVSLRRLMPNPAAPASMGRVLHRAAISGRATQDVLPCYWHTGVRTKIKPCFPSTSQSLKSLVPQAAACISLEGCPSRGQARESLRAVQVPSAQGQACALVCPGGTCPVHWLSPLQTSAACCGRLTQLLLHLHQIARQGSLLHQQWVLGLAVAPRLKPSRALKALSGLYSAPGACRRPRGFGFVEFVDTRDAEDAMYALDGKNMGGRDISVS